MHRSQLIADLQRYQATYPVETSVIQKFVQFVNDHPDCFNRSLEKGHVTGSAWLLNLDSNKVLLTLHKKLGKWLQLGGHADGEIDVLKTALKEAQEESGIPQIEVLNSEIMDIDIHLIPENSKEKKHFHYDVRYLLKVKISEQFKVSSESKNLAWVPLKKISDYSTEQSLIRMADKCLEFLENQL